MTLMRGNLKKRWEDKLMPSIKTDKKKLEVIFKCKSCGEMKWVLETFSKGCGKVAEDATKEFEK